MNSASTDELDQHVTYHFDESDRTAGSSPRDGDMITPKSAETKNFHGHEVRAIVPKSFVTNLPQSTTSHRLPPQSVTKRQQTVVYQSLPTSGTPSQQPQFLIGKAQKTSTPSYEAPETPHERRRDQKSAWSRVPPPIKTAITPSFSLSNKLNRSSLHLDSDRATPFHAITDAQQQEVLIAANRQTGHFLQISKLGSSTPILSASLDTGLNLPPKSAHPRNFGLYRHHPHNKDPQTIIQHLINVSKGIPENNDRKTPTSHSLAIVRRSQQLSARSMSRLAVVGDQIDLGSNETGRPSAVPATPTTPVVPSDSGRLSTTNTSPPSRALHSQSSYRMTLTYSEPTISVRALPFSVLPKLVTAPPSTPTPKQLVVRSTEDYLHLLGFDRRHMIKFPEKNPRFKIMPTVLNTAAFQSAETRQFPIRTVKSPRASTNSLRTVAI